MSKRWDDARTDIGGQRSTLNRRLSTFAQQIGADATRFFKRLFTPPFGNFLVVTAQQDLGNVPAAKFGGAGVLWKLEEACGKGIVARALDVAEDSRHESNDGVDEDDGGDDPVGQDVIANRYLFVDQMIDDALIDAFIMTT